MVIYLLMNYEHIFIHSCEITYLSFGLSSRRGVLFQHHWNFFPVEKRIFHRNQMYGNYFTKTG